VCALQGQPVLQLLVVRKSGGGAKSRKGRGDEGEFGEQFHSEGLMFVSRFRWVRSLNSETSDTPPNPYDFCTGGGFRISGKIQGFAGWPV
jgi:hypothetical protein